MRLRFLVGSQISFRKSYKYWQARSPFTEVMFSYRVTAQGQNKEKEINKYTRTENLGRLTTVNTRIQTNALTIGQQVETPHWHMPLDPPLLHGRFIKRSSKQCVDIAHPLRLQNGVICITSEHAGGLLALPEPWTWNGDEQELFPSEEIDSECTSTGKAIPNFWRRYEFDQS